MPSIRGAWRRTVVALVALPLVALGSLARGASIDPPAPLTCDNSSYTDATGHCSPLHPGDSVGFPGFYCTLNFLWTDARGNRYFGTAGHCTVGSKIGAVATDGYFRPIGRLVYRVWDPADDAKDFALIRLFPRVLASGRLRHWGGPTAPFVGYDAQPSALCFFGQADGLGVAMAPRKLFVTGITQPSIVLVNGVVSFGDSGAPVIRPDGRAVGWVESIADGYHLPVATAHGGVEVGEEVVTRIGPAVRAAERGLHVALRLVTAQHQTCGSSAL